MSIPNYYANSLLDKLKIASVNDLKLLELIARERGALVQDKPLKGAEARIAFVGRKAIITVSTSIIDPRRRRFSIAHELGHFEMHRTHGNLALCTEADLEAWETKGAGAVREQEANEFAAALLLPERFFAARCKDQDPSLNLISELADAFDVSLTATAIRFIQFTNEACAVVFAKDGYVKWFRRSKGFQALDVFIEGRSKPDPATHAAALFDGRSNLKKARHVEASAWFSSGRFRDGATIVEQSWFFSEYGAVLTLLWVDDDIEELEDDEE